MLKLTPIENEKNKFIVNYSVCHTDVYERDIWMHAEPLQIYNVETEEELKEYLECFNIVKLAVDKARTGRGEAAEYINFEEFADEDKYEKIEWEDGLGVTFVKDGKEYFVYIVDDIGMPKEDGHFLQGSKLEYITYCDQNGLEHYVTIDE